jgi:hypothetical protein
MLNYILLFSAIGSAGMTAFIAGRMHERKSIDILSNIEECHHLNHADTHFDYSEICEDLSDE